MRIAVVGLGAVGTRAARQLASTPGVTSIVLCEPHAAKRAAVSEVLGPIAEAVAWPEDGDLPDGVGDCDATLLAGPTETHLDQVRRLLALRRPVVSVSDSLTEVRSLLELDGEAVEHGVPVVVGAAFSPGLSCVLARHGASWFERVDEIHVAWIGTGGPACAHQHHTSFGGRSVEWIDGEWLQRPSGSGRELCWFPDPVGAADCYRGALPEPLLLETSFHGVQRITAKLAGTRRDRLTARLPMLRPPHPEGSVGALRVELRGWRNGASDTVVLGAMDRPAVAGGAVAALAVFMAASGTLARDGVAGLAEQVEPLPFLTELARRGVRAATFEGADATAAAS
jgi:saccharopine dehydrogenase-like NADP-dependent oxidoreductase